MSSELWKILYDVGIFRCMMCCEVGTVLMKLSAVHIKSTQTPVCIGQMYYKIYIYILYTSTVYTILYRRIWVWVSRLPQSFSAPSDWVLALVMPVKICAQSCYKVVSLVDWKASREAKRPLFVVGRFSSILVLLIISYCTVRGRFSES